MAMAVGAAALAGLIGVLRTRLLARARRERSAWVPSRVGPDGILEGAEPLLLQGRPDRRVLILHGFNDSPQSVGELGHALHALGWTVHVPLLPGHGRDPLVLARTGSADAWIAGARNEWQQIQRGDGVTVLIGQSMGGALATLLAAESPPRCLVLLAPYLSMQPLPRLLSHVWPAWQLVVPVLFGNPRLGLRDPAARAARVGPATFTPRLVAELREVVDRADRSLAAVSAPALVLHSRTDYRIPVSAAERAFERLGSTDKSLVWRDAGHVLAADVGRHEVFTMIADWIESHIAGARVEKEMGADPAETT